MKEIPLTQGKVALVDDEDYKRVSQYNWCAWEPNRAGRFYAGSRINNHWLLMHRFILRITDPKVVCDHLNGDGLDNRRANIHAVSQTFNLFNKSKMVHL